MASEIQINASMTFSKSGSADGMRVAITPTLAGTKYIHGRQSIGFAAEEAINLGEATAGGWVMFLNRDATNFIALRSAATETPFAQLKAGESCGPFRLHGSATAPTAQADTAACELEFLILVP